eukprot:gnl/TRDRNA2_/TRDRNA2_132239_c1_seq1.p1 gnl/TRDRNA2_/TRDRNA2_132239_c1~~gnl/TRDRNA2_/TRDRNA2_132239_c1_seq1.p1  ORF type:complete len:131 (-),score=15.81 gnl/TRDRNA2_/TRDRNA2_132239_c1_seq1:34-426(-)
MWCTVIDHERKTWKGPLALSLPTKRGIAHVEDLSSGYIEVKHALISACTTWITGGINRNVGMIYTSTDAMSCNEAKVLGFVPVIDGRDEEGQVWFMRGAMAQDGTTEEADPEPKRRRIAPFVSRWKGRRI